MSCQRYAKPPLQEVVCEIHPHFSQSVDGEVLEKMVKLWSPSYPQITIVDDSESELQIGVEGIRFNQKPLGQRVICRSQDGLKLAQLSNRFIAVNHLAPYPGWRDGFRTSILSRIEEVVTVVPFDRIGKISLRYIDRIEIPQKPLRWQDWFELDLALPESFRDAGAALNLAFTNRIGEELQARLEIAGDVSSLAGISTVMLNLDIFSSRQISLDRLEEELDRVHEQHSNAFECLLKDQTRELFR